MSRIKAKFTQLAAAKRKALVPFVTAGDPSLEATVPVMHALVAAGADAIELGVPFSDPMADGPVIQKAGENTPAFPNTVGYFNTAYSEINPPIELPAIDVLATSAFVRNR